jgi:hypothetical protein
MRNFMRAAGPQRDIKGTERSRTTGSGRPSTPLVRDLTQRLFFGVNELGHIRIRKIAGVSEYQ